MAEQRHIIRIANTDLDGKKHILIALGKIKGIGRSIAHGLLHASGINPATKAGAITEAEEAQLNDLVADPRKAGLPDWMLNRQKDPETGQDSHLVGSDVNFFRDNDIKFQRKLKTYKGQRHALRLPVRGQRTRSNFRRHRKKQVSKRVKS